MNPSPDNGLSPLPGFLAWLRHEKRYSAHTVDAYRRDLDQFLAFLAEVHDIPATEPGLVRHGHIRSWLVHLLERDVSARSSSRKLSSLRTYWRYLRRLGLAGADPTTKVIAPRQPARLPRTVQATDLDRLFRRLEAREEEEPVPGFSHLRDRTALELLYGCGLRRAELIGLRDVDVDLAGRRLRVHGKGNKERILPVGDRLADTLRAYGAARDRAFGPSAEGPLLRTDKGAPLYPKWVYRTVRACLAAVTAAEGLGPHALRHSFATHLADGGAELNAIKALLGHASLASTQVYTHNSTERLREVYRQAHPRAEDS